MVETARDYKHVHKKQTLFTGRIIAGAIIVVEHALCRLRQHGNIYIYSHEKRLAPRAEVRHSILPLHPGQFPTTK
jgi:hypothetical protein